jgi:hypothetical protein
MNINCRRRKENVWPFCSIGQGHGRLTVWENIMDLYLNASLCSKPRARVGKGTFVTDIFVKGNFAKNICPTARSLAVKAK